MKNPQTTVVMCSDESYIIPTYIALFSLLKNYRGTNELAVFILTRNTENFSKYMNVNFPRNSDSTSKMSL